MITTKKLVNNFDKIQVWLLFGVLITLLPLLIDFLFLVIQGKPIENVLQVISPKGELFIVAASVLGESLKELFALGRKKRLKMILGGLSMIMLIVVSCMYGFIRNSSIGGAMGINFNSGGIQFTQITLTITFVLALSCKISGNKA